MRTTGLRKLTRRLIKKGQIGQSIVILALGFVALLGFVGIVVDVSMLFIRYSTLRRAVDAAAVAAATQMRREIDAFPDDPNIDTGGAVSFAKMNLAARQFIELYGLSPSEVLVESCDRENDSGMDEQDPELCINQRKLVRVTATMESPTMFLQVLGFPSLRLIASSISETAVLDVVLILSVSESMLDSTTYQDWENMGTELGLSPNPYRAVYLPARLPYLEGSDITKGEDGTGIDINAYNVWKNQILPRTQSQINDWADDAANQVLTLNTLYGSQTFQMYTKVYINGVLQPATAFADAAAANQPRVECRARVYPFARFAPTIRQWSPGLLQQYFALLGNNNANIRDYFNLPSSVGSYTSAQAEAFYYFAGWVPTFNYFGCCNDPNGDGDFTDLVCQPFKQARDESINFLDRIDFLRGDRVAIVTYDQQAHIMVPAGTTINSTANDVGGTMIIDPNIGEVQGGEQLWMIDNQGLAAQLLRTQVGVRGEPTYYFDDDGTGTADGTWNGLVVGSTPTGRPIIASPRYDSPGGYYANKPISQITWYPVANNCPFAIGTMDDPFTIWQHTGEPLYAIMNPMWMRTGTWLAAHAGYTNVNTRVQVAMRWSYENRGSCRNANVGGALIKGQEALSDPNQSRTEGAVWIMVLLGDGAAGGSDPVKDSSLGGSGAPRPARPYLDEFPADGVLDAPGVRAGQYGAYGVCPYPQSEQSMVQMSAARDANPVQVEGTVPIEIGDDPNFPFCSDEAPQSRHFCGAPDEVIPNDPNQLDLTNTPTCRYEYDVDDYARDWADYVGGITQTTTSGEAQLPTIFTIGFGLDFETGYPGTCKDNDFRLHKTADGTDHTEECLGEELLRYIADVGDNFNVDDDYWQKWLADNGIFAENLASMNAEELRVFYGVRGPCQEELGPYEVYAPLPPGESCGNYFNVEGGAGAESELAKVFNEIASRMFTRLSR